MNSDKTRILLVEDEALIALHEQKQLESRGYCVDHVLDGETAIRQVLASGTSYDLVLMDVDLGNGIDGPQAAERILETRDLPIVFLSSHSEPNIVEKTEKITSYGYVLKNTGIVVLDASIKMALKLFQEKSKRVKTEKDLMRAKEIAEENEKKYKVIFNSTGTANNIFDRNCVLQLQNNLSKEALGKDGIGLSVFELFGETTGKLLFERMQKVIKEGKPDDFETEFSLATGNRWFRSFYQPVFDENNSVIAVQVISQEISKLKKTEIELTKEQDKAEETRSLLQNIADNIPAYIAAVDINTLKYLFVNKKFVVGFGKKREEIIGSHIIDIIGQKNYEFALEYINLVREGKSASYVNSFNLVEGPVYANVNYVPGYNERNELDKILVLTFDITEQKKLEEQLNKQLLEKEILLNDVNHRIKNNITTIESYLSIQAGMQNNTEVKQILLDAISRVQSMRILYERLLMHGGHDEVSMRDYAVNLIASTRAVFSEHAATTIETEIADFTMSARQATLVGIIINELLTNIFKYAFNDGRKGRIYISLQKTGSELTLNIRDNGTGFDVRNQALKPQCFGLTIIKMLTEQMNGTFEILNENGTNCFVHVKT